MNLRQILLALLLTGASFAVLWLVMGSERTVPLIEIEETPRVAVAPADDSKSLVLTGLAGRVQGSGNDLRKARNELARKHRHGISQWKAGRLTLREVERIEQLLWVARFKVGEIDEPTLHRQLAELFSREHRRLQILQDRGLAGPDEVERAALYVAREQHLAGERVTDAQGRTYEQMRRAYLERMHTHYTALIEGGLGHREQMKLDLLQLAEEFPPTK
ncbi:MAG: hypothetical protein P1V36_07070 [Planctomycetota bacterium]|nr:hypothetical protein [Planctomycetota bacterium]